MRVLLTVAAFSLLTAPAFATDIRSVVADPYGNAVITTQGGAKIIAVGQADLAETFVAADTPSTLGQNCREVGIVLKGRSFMYGVSDGDPVPSATKIVCE